jgi:hypothetical protein
MKDSEANTNGRQRRTNVSATLFDSTATPISLHIAVSEGSAESQFRLVTASASSHGYFGMDPRLLDRPDVDALRLISSTIAGTGAREATRRPTEAQV